MNYYFRSDWQRETGIMTDFSIVALDIERKSMCRPFGLHIAFMGLHFTVQWGDCK